MSKHSTLRGTDLHAPTNELIEQSTGSTITQFSIVSLSGMGTVYPSVVLANPNINNSFGIAQTDILTGKSGIITCLGFMFNVNTNAWAANTLLYSDVSGQLSSVSLGAPVAVVIKQDSVYGVLYVVTSLSFIDTDINSAWSLTGNAGVNPATEFLGTTDAKPINIRTNNAQIASFDANGRFAIGAQSPRSPLDIKPYSGYSASGLQIEPFAVSSNVTTPTAAYTINMTNGQIVRVKFTIACRQSDGAGRATFTRTALFYKEGGNVQIQGPTWQSDVTIKSNNGFDVTYTLGVNTITFNVKNATNTTSYWSGHVEMEFVGTNL